MSWHVALSGECIMPRGKTAPWLEHTLDPSSMKDWAAKWPAWFNAGFAATKVASLLESIARFNATSGHEFVQVTVQDREIVVRGLLSEGNVPDWLEKLVAAMRAAATFGGVGRLLVLGLASPVSAKLTLASRKATWETLTEQAASLLGSARLVQEVQKLSNARPPGKAAPAPPPAPAKAEKPGLPRAVGEALAHVSDALAKHSASDVLAAARRADVYVYSRKDQRPFPLTSVFADGKAILDACTGSSKVVDLALDGTVPGKHGAALASGVRILAELDAKAASPLAQALFQGAGSPGAVERPEMHFVRLEAARALGRLSTPQSLDALVADIDVNALFYVAAGLARARAELAAPRLLSLLTPKLLASAQGQGGVQFLFEALGELGDDGATSALASILEKRGKIEVRRWAAEALLAIGSGGALRAVEAHVDDKDPTLASFGTRALLQRDPAAALRRFRGDLLKKKGPRDVAYRVLLALVGATQGVGIRQIDAPRPAETIALTTDPDWIAVVAGLVEDPELGGAAINYLAATRRPEAARALGEHLGTDQAELLCHALEYIGDKSVLPVLDAYVAKAKRDPSAERVKAAVQRIRRGERPDSLYAPEQ